MHAPLTFDSLAQLVPLAHSVRVAILGAAKVMPVVVLVPALGMRALPWGARLGLALTLGLSVSPALSQSTDLPLGIAVALQALSGLPVALSAAALLWAASMAGGLIDELRQSRDLTPMPMLSEPSSPTGVLFALVAAVAFLKTGGAGRVVSALNRTTPNSHELLTRVVQDLLGGTHIAIAVAVPFLLAIVLLEVTAALVLRAVTTSNLQSIWAPLRTVFVLLFLAVAFERVLAAIAVFSARPL